LLCGCFSDFKLIDPLGVVMGAKLVLVFWVMVVAVSVLHATTPIKLVRGPFVSKEVVQLNMQAQDQMMKDDLAGAAKTIRLAMQKDPTLWLTYFSRARLFFCEEKYELANEDCNWVLLKYPKFVEAALLRAQSNAHLSRYADALKELDHVVRIRPPMDSYARALQVRAWFLATCPDPSFRNGKQAVLDAKVACKVTHWTDDAALDSLAAACAETGDFDSAVNYAQQALAVKNAMPRDLKTIRRHLESFKQHKPVRSS
jgi:tetratricopeptide (TPR) repeat protein